MGGRDIKVRDPGWILTAVVGLAALAVALTALVLRFAAPTVDAVIPTEAWPWTSTGVRIEPTSARSAFRSGDLVLAIDGRPMAGWVDGLPGLGGPANPPIGPAVTVDVLRDGQPIRLTVERGVEPIERLGGAPIGVVLLATLVLVLATLLVRRRSRALALRLLFVLGAAHAADITAWEIGLQPTDFGANAAFVAVFVLAAGFNLVFWSALVHLLLVYPTRDPLAIHHRWLVPAVYVTPFVAAIVLAIAARLAGGTTLDWVDRLAACVAAVASAMLVAVLGATAAAWHRATPGVRRSVRWVAVSLVVAAASTLVLLTLPIVATGAPIVPRNALDLLALPVPVALAVAVIRDRLFQVALLSRTRERLIAAREDERRRLRRDLHDGLAPSLAAVGLKLDHARASVRSSPDEAEAVLEEARADVRAVIGEIRRMSRELRPPTLDSLGLIGAIRHAADELSDDGEGPVRILVEADGPLPPLAAAVEVAAYRITVEAMMNAVRHAGSATCRVGIGLSDETLEIEVADDGRGLTSAAPGVGVRAMRERAAEVGGDVTIDAGRTVGTVVRARLPVEPAPAVARRGAAAREVSPS